MGAVQFRSSILALAGLCLSLTLHGAFAQGGLPAKPAPITEKPLAPPQQPAAQQVQPAPVAGRSDVAGRYIILREGGKDVGCMLTLEAAARGPGGDLKAQLAPACRDQGIVVFDPVAWRLERGRLVLTARKGHAATFDKQADGVWWKDLAEGGKPLGVKKI
jgi:hypothetical protein